MRVRSAGSPCGAVAPSTTVAVQVDVTAGSFRRTCVAAQKCRRRCRASDEISLRLRRTRQSDLRSNIREPRKSDHAAGMLADIMVVPSTARLAEKRAEPAAEQAYGSTTLRRETPAKTPEFPANRPHAARSADIGFYGVCVCLTGVRASGDGQWPIKTCRPRALARRAKRRRQSRPKGAACAPPGAAETGVSSGASGPAADRRFHASRSRVRCARSVGEWVR